MMIRFSQLTRELIFAFGVGNDCLGSIGTLVTHQESGAVFIGGDSSKYVLGEEEFLGLKQEQLSSTITLMSSLFVLFE